MVFFESWVIQFLQSILPYSAYELMNMIGHELIYVILLGVIYWCINKREGQIAINIVMFSNFLNILLKYAFRMPRPDPSLRQDPEYATDQSYGFPSGSTQTATTFWGWASIKLRRWWLWTIGIIFIFVTAIARIGLGLHFLGDVIGGILVGIIIVTMAYFLVPYLRRYWKRMPKYLQDWLLPSAALFFFICFLCAYALGIPYFPSENIAISMGVVFGFGVGVMLESRFINFTTEVTWKTKGIRTILGFVLALIIYYLLTFAFSFTAIIPLLHYSTRFIKYILVGFFGAFIIPFFFKYTDKISEAKSFHTEVVIPGM